MKLDFQPWLKSEIRQDVLDTFDDRLDSKVLPFKNIFGKRYRVVVPFVTDEHQKLAAELHNAGYDRIDWASGSVFKKKPTVGRNGKPLVDKQGNPFPEGETSTAIGKAINRLPDAKYWLDWWSKNQHFAPEWAKQGDAINYAVVISRHPVDVLRMSDFQTITSCHTPPGQFNNSGGSYWDSCKQEALTGGLVAFVVKMKDLEGIPKDELEGDGEIFDDNERRLKGIKPLARLRIRRYTNRYDKKDNLAVPELRTYGARIPDFQEFVTKWAREAQGINDDSELPNLKDYVRRGGEYADNSDDSLFNNFYNTDEFEGESDWGMGDKDRHGIDDQRREEIEQFSQRWRQRFQHCWADYEESDYEHDGGVNFDFSGGVSVELPAERFKGAQKEVSDLDGQDEYSGRTWDQEAGKYKDAEAPTLLKWLSDNTVQDYYGLNYINVHEKGSVVRFGFSFQSEEHNSGTPDDFNEFCEELESQFEGDKDYANFVKAVMGYLMKYGYMNASDNVMYQSEHPNEKFKNLEWDDEGQPTLYSRVDLAPVSDPYHQGLQPRNVDPFNKQVEMAVRGMIFKAIQSHKMANHKQPWLPGMHDQQLPGLRNVYEKVELDAATIEFGVDKGDKYLPTWYIYIAIEFDEKLDKLRMDRLITLAHVVDDTLPSIVTFCSQKIAEYEKRENLWQHDAMNRIGRSDDYYQGINPYRSPSEQPGPRYTRTSNWDQTPPHMRTPEPETGFQEPRKPHPTKEGFQGFMAWKLIQEQAARRLARTSA